MAIGEWDQRQLCADGGCIGVIGPDGTCKVCGRAAPNWGDERTRGLVQPPEDEGEHAGDDADDADDDDPAAAADEGAEDEDDVAADADAEAGDRRGDAPMAAAPAAAIPREWTERQLCPDGACIGLIGPDGRCRQCGRSAAPDAGAISAAPDAGAISAAGPEIASPGDRERCADASCTGAIGADGRCEVCGKGAS